MRYRSTQENRKSARIIKKRADNQKARRRIEKQMARNRKTRNRRIKAPEPKPESVGAEIRKRAGTESESVQFAHHLVEMKDSVDGIAFRTVFGVTGHEF